MTDTHEQRLKYDLLTERTNTEKFRQVLLRRLTELTEEQFRLVREQREKLRGKGRTRV